MHPPYELSARVCCDESNCFHSSSSTAMRGSLRAEEAMEATGMLAALDDAPQLVFAIFGERYSKGGCRVSNRRRLHAG